MMINLADEIVVGFASENGQLNKLLMTVSKPVYHLASE